MRSVVEHGSRVIGIVVLLIVWQLIISVIKPPPVVLPSPWSVVRALFVLAQTSTLWWNITISLFRVVSGFLLAAAMGIPIGLCLARFQIVNYTIQPTLEGLRFVIPFAWIPIASFWFGLSESGKIFITWYAAFFIITFQTEMGFRKVDELLVKAAKTLGAETRYLLWKVYFPAAAPAIVTGLRLALAFSWIAILAAELVNAKAGIGYFTLNASDLFETNQAFASIIVIGIIGFGMDRGFQFLELRMFAWYRGDDAVQ